MKIKWCKNCVLPNTRPNLFLDKSGICNACNIKLEKKNKKYFKPLGKKKFEKTIRNILKNNPTIGIRTIAIINHFLLFITIIFNFY